MTSFEVKTIAIVHSPLTLPDRAPPQADEGAPEALLVFVPEVREGLSNIVAGDEVFLLTWLHLSRRNVLRVHARGDTTRTLEGVFSTRPQDRPNPIGLHRLEITGVDGVHVRVRGLEAVNGTPVIDVKPVLSEDIHLR